MKAQILAKYDLKCPLTAVMAFGNKQAVCLSNWGRSIFTLFDGVTCHTNFNDKKAILAGYGDKHKSRPDHWPPNEEEFEYFFPKSENQGAIFAYKQGFGIVYNDSVYLCSDIKDPLTCLPISNTLAPHSKHSHLTHNPLLASYIADTNQVIVVLSDYHCPQIGRTIGKLTIKEDSAIWDSQVFEVDFHKLEFVAKPLWKVFNLVEEVLEGSGKEPQIGSILAINDQEILVNAVRSRMLQDISNYSYSALGLLQAKGNMDLIKVLPIGRTLFSSDKENLLINIERGEENSKLLFCNTKGESLNTLILTQEMLNPIGSFDMVFDKKGDELWIVDTYSGYVNHYQLTMD